MIRGSPPCWLKSPHRLVWSRQDALVPLECSQLYQQAIPSSELVVIEQCRHLPPLEKPEVFVRLALEFLLSEYWR